MGRGLSVLFLRLSYIVWNNLWGSIQRLYSTVNFQGVDLWVTLISKTSFLKTCPVKLLIVPLYSGCPGYSEPGVVVPGRWLVGLASGRLLSAVSRTASLLYALLNVQKCDPREPDQFWGAIRWYLKWRSRQDTGFEVRQPWVQIQTLHLEALFFWAKWASIVSSVKTKIITPAMAGSLGWLRVRYCMHKNGLTAYYLGVHDLIAVLLMWWTHCYNYLTKKFCALPLVIVSIWCLCDNFRVWVTSRMKWHSICGSPVVLSQHSDFCEGDWAYIFICDFKKSENCFELWINKSLYLSKW